MTKKDIPSTILEHMAKLEWPSTTEDIAAAVKVSWNTAQVNLLKLANEGKVRYRKVGRQNQWWLEKNFKENFGK